MSQTQFLEGARIYQNGTCTGSVPLSCKTSDVLVTQFENIQAGSCTATTIARLSLGVEGAEVFKVAAGCIPDGYILEDTLPDGAWRVREFVGDPAEMPGGAPKCSGFYSSEPPTTGYSQSPWASGSDPAGTPPGGTGTPISGGSGGGGGGPGANGGTGTGGTDNPPPTGGGGGGGGGGGQTPAETQGAVKAGVKEALDEIGSEGETGLGSLLNPVYDPSIEAPVENDWVQLVRDYLAINPLAAWATGTTMTASGSCSISGDNGFGGSINLDFCPLEPYLSAIGIFLIALAGLYSLYVAFGMS